MKLSSEISYVRSPIALSSVVEIRVLFIVSLGCRYRVRGLNEGIFHVNLVGPRFAMALVVLLVILIGLLRIHFKFNSVYYFYLLSVELHSKLLISFKSCSP